MVTSASSSVDPDNPEEPGEESSTKESQSFETRSEARELHFDEDRLSASAVGNIVGMQAQEIVEVAERYASLSISEMEVGID